ncbi:cysteine proteinase inhibitor A-like [Pyrus x bretschneideri]|uniref:cysteine proteinase inhibitor A-like n=1 Tax=Pyrus x bretschneideri TaxID=225117 RepID=UPI0020302CFB|nr:cysteine proteinase inhibitor A-like [Pyrus x bretschneideri]
MRQEDEETNEEDKAWHNTQYVAAMAAAMVCQPQKSSSSSTGKNMKVKVHRELAAESNMAAVGTVRENEGFANSVETENLARFAIDEHNNKENALLEFVRVVHEKVQVVSGSLHHLKIEATDGGKKNVYEAKVWVKRWENFKQLQEFKLVSDS